MLDRKDIVYTLGMTTKKYINCLERNNFDYSQYKGEMIAYMKVLEIDGKYSGFIDIDVAKKLLSEIEIL